MEDVQTHGDLDSGAMRQGLQHAQNLGGSVVGTEDGYHHDGIQHSEAGESRVSGEQPIPGNYAPSVGNTSVSTGQMASVYSPSEVGGNHQMNTPAM